MKRYIVNYERGGHFLQCVVEADDIEMAVDAAVRHYSVSPQEIVFITQSVYWVQLQTALSTTADRLRLLGEHVNAAVGLRAG